MNIENKHARYISHLIIIVLTIICLLLSYVWYFGVWEPKKVDYVNFFILALLFYLTWQALYKYYITRKENVIFSEIEINNKIMNVEFLRVLFTLEIVVHHTIKGLEINNKGWYGVEFFFILSGFFLAYTFNDDCSVMRFIRKKIIRFLPLITVGSLLNILYYKDVNIARFLSAIFFLPGTGLVSLHSYLGPAWYLSVLFWVSIFYFYIMKSISPSQGNLIIGVLTFVAYLIFVRGASIKWGSFIVLGQKGTFESIIHMTFIRGIMSIGLGYFIAIWWKSISHNFEYKIIKNKQYFLFGIMECFFLIFSLLMLFDSKLFPSQTIFVHISFITLICLWLIRKGFLSNLTNNILFLKLSKYSLAIYLCHSCIAEHLVPLLKRKYPDFIMEHIVLVVISSLTVSILIGVWAHYVIEKPGEKFLRKVLK